MTVVSKVPTLKQVYDVLKYCINYDRNFDKFQIEQVIGFGAHGITVVATDHTSSFAVKIIHKQSVAYDSTGTLMEVSTMMTFRGESGHLGIVEYYGSWENDRFHCIKLELHGTNWMEPTEELLCMDGGKILVSPGRCDLWSWMNTVKKNDELSDSEYSLLQRYIKIIFTQVSSAIRHIHSFGVVHADLKPENILIRDKGSEGLIAKVCDFGNSVYQGDIPALRLYGTSEVTAPEVTTHVLVSGFEADVYALGCILYFMLHNGDYPSERDGVINDRVDPGLKHLIQCMTVVDPTQRPDMYQVVEYLSRQ